MRIEIVVFDGFDELDAIGPFEVLRHGVRAGAGFEIELVGAHGPGLIHATNGLTLTVSRGLGTPDAVIVPGGGWLDGRAEGARAQAERGVLPARLAALAPSLRWTAPPTPSSTSARARSGVRLSRASASTSTRRPNR